LALETMSGASHVMQHTTLTIVECQLVCDVRGIIKQTPS
jgi:hypothetical protein